MCVHLRLAFRSPMPLITLFLTQCLNWIEPRGAPCRPEPEDYSDDRRDTDAQHCRPCAYQQRKAHRQRQQVSQRSEEHTSELQSQFHLVCRLLLEKKKKTINNITHYTQRQQTLPTST